MSLSSSQHNLGPAFTYAPDPVANGQDSSGFDRLLSAFAMATGIETGPVVLSYLTQVYEDYSADVAGDPPLAILASPLAEAWCAAQGRQSGFTIVELKSLTGPGLCSTADVLTVIQDDRPFLVDSVMGELAEAGVTVRSMFHPIVEGPNGRTSIIIVVLDALPQERRDVLAEALAQTLSDVRAAVTDHAAMQALIGQSIAHLEATPAGTDPEVLAENLAFLRWLQADHFVFLGARAYEFPRSGDGGYEAAAPLSQSGEGLGALADPERTVLRRANEPAVLTKSMKRQLNLSEPVTVAKANVRSRVHLFARGEPMPLREMASVEMRKRNLSL